jgi:hypothetical protein
MLCVSMLIVVVQCHMLSVVFLSVLIISIVMLNVVTFSVTAVLGVALLLLY